MEIETKFNIGDKVIYKRNNKDIDLICEILYITVDEQGIGYAVKIEYNGEKEHFLEKDLQPYIPPILTAKEKDYLSNVIKPFRDKVIHLYKTKKDTFEYIGIVIDDDNNTLLPTFPKGTMYKGMETDKSYTLWELGL